MLFKEFASQTISGRNSEGGSEDDRDVRIYSDGEMEYSAAVPALSAVFVCVRAARGARGQRQKERENEMVDVRSSSAAS